MEPTVRELENLVFSYMPDLVFLMEVKVGRDHVAKVRKRIRFDGCFYITHINHGGGLALFWKERNLVNLNKFGRNFIDVNVREEEQNWRLSCFYGWPENNNRRRRESWDSLRSLSDVNNLPWCVIGDFNDMLSSNEKRGGNPRPLAWIEGFNEAVNSCGLLDLGLVGSDFTWERGRGSNNWMAERLDRAMCNVIGAETSVVPGSEIWKHLALIIRPFYYRVSNFRRLESRILSLKMAGPCKENVETLCEDAGRPRSWIVWASFISVLLNFKLGEAIKGAISRIS